MTEIEDSPTIQAQATLSIRDLARELGRLSNGGVLKFLTLLDGHMASWDFTQAAARLFFNESLKSTVRDDGALLDQRSVVRRVAEFHRQARKQPHTKATGFIAGAWTDPEGQPGELTDSDLSAILNLACIALDMLENK